MAALGMVLVAVVALLIVTVCLFKIKGIILARGLGKGLGGCPIQPPLVLTDEWV